jgi:8-oxo-dGTP diphosphatase
MPTGHEPLPVVCALILDDAGRVLVARRPAHKHLSGLWEFPGGKIEAGEPPEAALVREIREELGCEVAPVRALARQRYDYGSVFVELIPFMARLMPTSPSPQPTEHDEIKWIYTNYLNSLDLAPADRLVAAELDQNGPKAEN